MAEAFIGAGSNQADPLDQLSAGLSALATAPGLHLQALSYAYLSQPQGPQDQPAFVNAVARISTELEPRALLDALQRIEAARGRRRDGERWGPRVLDLDILSYADQRINSPELIIPHPRIGEREFVLVPLAELAPRMRLADTASVAELAAQCPRRGLQRLGRIALEAGVAGDLLRRDE